MSTQPTDPFDDPDPELARAFDRLSRRYPDVSQRWRSELTRDSEVPRRAGDS